MGKRGGSRSARPLPPTKGGIQREEDESTRLEPDFRFTPFFKKEMQMTYTEFEKKYGGDELRVPLTLGTNRINAGYVDKDEAERYIDTDVFKQQLNKINAGERPVVTVFRVGDTLEYSLNQSDENIANYLAYKMSGIKEIPTEVRFVDKYHEPLYHERIVRAAIDKGIIPPENVTKDYWLNPDYSDMVNKYGIEHTVKLYVQLNGSYVGIDDFGDGLGKLPLRNDVIRGVLERAVETGHPEDAWGKYIIRSAKDKEYVIKKHGKNYWEENYGERYEELLKYIKGKPYIDPDDFGKPPAAFSKFIEMNNPKYVGFSAREHSEYLTREMFYNWAASYYKRIERSDKSYYHLNEYKHTEYEHINNYLVKLRDNPKHKDERIVEFVKGIDKSMKPIPNNVVVYRSFRTQDLFPNLNYQDYYKGIDADKLQGTVFNKIPAYMSSSVSRDISARFAGYRNETVIMKLYVPKGTEGIPVEVALGYSNKNKISAENEGEMLLHRDLSIRVLGAHFGKIRDPREAANDLSYDYTRPDQSVLFIEAEVIK